MKEKINDFKLNQLPYGDVETKVKCPNCGFYGKSAIDSTIHNAIQSKMTESGKEYLHCTACNTDFKIPKDR